MTTLAEHRDTTYDVPLTAAQQAVPVDHWSHSAVDKGAHCPAQWAYRNGPLRNLAPDPAPFAPRQRGNVIHDAFAATLQAALADAATDPRLVGAELRRWWPQARTALGTAWDTHRMPSDRGEAVACVDMLRYLLRVTRVPAPRDVWALEDKRDTRTPGGRTFRYVIDYARWVPGGLLRITDYKTGRDDPDTLEDNQQLHRYGWCAAADLDLDPARVQIELHNVRTRRTRVLALDPRRARRAIERVDEIAARLEAATATGRIPARPGPRCTHCDAAPICPALAAYRAPVAPDPDDEP